MTTCRHEWLGQKLLTQEWGTASCQVTQTHNQAATLTTTSTVESSRRPFHQSLLVWQSNAAPGCADPQLAEGHTSAHRLAALNGAVEKATRYVCGPQLWQTEQHSTSRSAAAA